jgi:hypothetical protein
MSQLDRDHAKVRQALLNSGWTILKEHFTDVYPLGREARQL